MGRLTSKKKAAAAVRVDPPELDPASVWGALSMTPGVGVSITDREGRIIYANPTLLLLFSNSPSIEYKGKTIADFHPPQFVKERLTWIRQVLDSGKPISVKHIYGGRRIYSTVWPIRDSRPPYGRAIVVSREVAADDVAEVLEPQIESVSTQYIDLGPLDVLTARELEVLVLIGHGMTVPEVAAHLYRSPKTIERHKSSISAKLGTHRQSDLVTIVTNLGLDIDDLKLRRMHRE